MNELTFIEDTYKNMIKSSSSRFRERNGLFCSHITKEALYNSVMKNKSGCVLVRGLWEVRMRSIIPTLEYLKENAPIDYERVYPLWCEYYYGEKAGIKLNNPLNSTKIDCLLDKWLDMVNDTEVSVDTMMNQLDDLLRTIYNYKISVENEVARIILERWRRRLSELSEIKIGREIQEFSVIACAIQNLKISLASDIKRPVMSCSLLTNNNYHTYQNREVGFLYNITLKNLISMCPTDSYANYCITDREYASFVIEELNAYDAVYFDIYEYTPWGVSTKVLPYEIMISNKESYNEIRLLEEETPIAVFCLKDAVAERLEELKSAAYIYSLPVFSVGDYLKRIL